MARGHIRSLAVSVAKKMSNAKAQTRTKLIDKDFQCRTCFGAQMVWFPLFASPFSFSFSHNPSSTPHLSVNFCGRLLVSRSFQVVSLALRLRCPAAHAFIGDITPADAARTDIGEKVRNTTSATAPSGISPIRSASDSGATRRLFAPKPATTRVR